MTKVEVRHQEERAAAIPEARLTLIEAAGLNAPHERPAEVISAVPRSLAGEPAHRARATEWA